MDNPDWHLIASQLRKPNGEMAADIGLRMNQSNFEMNMNLIRQMNPAPKSEVLEIGPGNGIFVNHLIELYPDVHYTGIDHSDEMVREARQNNVHHSPQKVCFLNMDIHDLQSAETLYDTIFTINTLYFWDQPQKTLATIRSLMNENACLWVGFRPEHIMKEHPFTAHGFQLYSLDKAIALLESCSFRIEDIQEYRENDNTSLAGHSLPMAHTLIKAYQS